MVPTCWLRHSPSPTNHKLNSPLPESGRGEFQLVICWGQLTGSLLLAGASLTGSRYPASSAAPGPQMPTIQMPTCSLLLLQQQICFSSSSSGSLLLFFISSIKYQTYTTVQARVETNPSSGALGFCMAAAPITCVRQKTPLGDN